MRKSSAAVLSTVLMLVMLVAAVVWGAHKGWRQERAQVEQSIVGLEEMLAARREVAHNLLTVASRHLPASDARVAELRRDAEDMGRKNTLTESAVLNNRVEQKAQEILDVLLQTDSVRADDRDLMYVSALLPQALEQTARLTEQAAYNQLAEGFNQRKRQSISGRLAGMLGIEDAEVFALSEATP